MRRLMHVLDFVEFDQRPTKEIIADVDAAGPVWLRVANFFDRALKVLDTLPRPQSVLWRLEYWTTDNGWPQVPGSERVDPAQFAKDLLSLGHQVVPYTYVDFNRRHLLDLVPAMAGLPFHVLPIAQKPPAGSLDRAAVRDLVDVPQNATVLGVAGLNHPAKCIDEVVTTFGRSRQDPGRWLLVSLIDEDGQSAEEIMAHWVSTMPGANLSQVRLRVEPYGSWEWMCGFYRAVDVLIVNSLCESWCRIVSEALGFGVPLLVRRAQCASNHVAPGLVLVDDFADIDGPWFQDAVAEAKTRAESLREFVKSRHSLDMVRAATLGVLRENTPPAQIAVFDRLAEDSEQRELLDTAIVY